MNRASSRGGSRRSPCGIFTNVSIWSHIRRLSNLFYWLSFIYISEFCWKNYYKLSLRYRWAFSFLSFKKRTSHTIRNLTFASVYRWKYYMYQLIQGSTLFISVPSRLLWFSFLTAAKIFLYCTSVHSALCSNITKNVPTIWNFGHFHQFFFWP